MDHDLFRIGPPYDSRCWVRDIPKGFSIFFFWILGGLLTKPPAPFISFFYSGLARRKSALSLIWLSLMSTAVVGFQWYLWGFSLAFSHNAGKFIGNLDNVGFRNVLARPSVGSSKIPDLLFAIYQCMFAAIT